MTMQHVVGMGGLACVGFTVSLFVTGLAFTDGALADQAKLGILACRCWPPRWVLVLRRGNAS